MITFGKSIENLSHYAVLAAPHRIRFVEGQRLPPLNDHVVMAVASLDHAGPTAVDHKNRVCISEDDRRACEAAIERCGDAIAVSVQTSRLINSPANCLAIEPLDGAAQAWFSARSSIYAPMRPGPFRGPQALNLIEHRHELADRMDGVSLLADAFSSESPSAKLHDHVRFLERAFKASITKVCTELLLPFLAASPVGFGYTADELAEWPRVRNRAAHADDQKQFARTAECRPLNHRMEQAALDVLMNKHDWHSASVLRRSLWHPAVGTTDRDGSIYLTAGLPANLEFTAIDVFGAYGLRLDLGWNWPTTWFSLLANEAVPRPVIAWHGAARDWSFTRPLDLQGD